MTEFISRNRGKEGYEIIIKTDSYEHYSAAVDFARRLIDHSKPKTNADRIKAMSNEELYALFREIYNAGAVYGVSYMYGKQPNNFAWTMKWLKQLAEEQ
jgi:hypothetical protein